MNFSIKRGARYFEVDDPEESLLGKPVKSKKTVTAPRIDSIFKKKELNKLERDKRLLIRRCNNVIRIQTVKIKYFGKKEFKCLVKLNRERFDYEALVYTIKHFKSKGYKARIGYDWSYNYISIKI